MSGLTFASLTPGRLTWDAAQRLFLLRCRSQNLSAATVENYTVRLGLLLRWLPENGNPAPGDTQAEHLRAFLGGCRARGNKATTLDCVWRVLNTFFGFLHRDGLLLQNPMGRVERPKKESRMVRGFNEEEIRKFLEQFDTRTVLGARDNALILFLADTGLRISEALAVKVGEVDWAGNCVKVLGKGRKERRVAFGHKTRQALILWLHKRGEAKPDDYLFVGRFGEQLRRNSVAHRIKKYTKAAGIAAPRLGAHALRHFFALAFLRGGGDSLALQRLLGHETLEMTRHYCSQLDDEALAQQRAASPLDRMGNLPNERKRVKLK